VKIQEDKKQNPRPHLEDLTAAKALGCGYNDGKSPASGNQFL